MPADTVPAIDPELLPVLAELSAREPIFHRPRYAATPADFARLMAADYWEFGASGQQYTRDFILETLQQTPPVDAARAGWQTSDFHCRRLAPDTYLLTYTLDQPHRKTRRSTIWQTTSAGWQILFHQGTIVAAS
jgi:hypothetical protein